MRMGRQARGVGNGMAKLVDDEVRAIRACGFGYTAMLAARYGVSCSTIKRVLSRELWTHLP